MRHIVKGPKVLLVTNLYPDEGDPAKGVFVRNIEVQLRKEGINVHVLAVANTRGRYGRLPLYMQFYYRVVKQLLRHDIALVYAHYVSHCAVPILLSNQLGRTVPVVCHVHGSDVLPEADTSWVYASIKRALAARILGASSRVIVPSAYYRDVLQEQYQISESALVVSPSGGVDLSVFCRAAEEDLRRSRLRLGFVGRLIEDKGVWDFIALIGALNALGQEVDAILVGDGPLQSRIEPFLEELQIEYSRTLTQRSLAEMYRDLDLFIFPSRRSSESLGLVGIEAMACGVPVVACRGAGPETYIEDRRTGFMVEPGAVDQMVAVVTAYAEMSPEERGVYRRAASHAAQRFSADSVGKDLARVLREVAS